MKKLMLICAILALSGCVTTPNSGNVYKANEAQNEQTVRMATVDSVRDIMIDKGASGVGKISGAALGGLAAGANVGKGNGSAAAAVVGAIAGGILGDNIENGLTNKKGFEITVKLDNGELRAIIQDADEVFKSGERVRLISNGRTTRVTH